MCKTGHSNPVPAPIISPGAAMAHGCCGGHVRHATPSTSVVIRPLTLLSGSRENCEAATGQTPASHIREP